MRLSTELVGHSGAFLRPGEINKYMAMRGLTMSLTLERF